MVSVWSDTSYLPKFESIQEDKITDVLIIGGGMAGILCAYFLNQAGVDNILVEAKTICSGITKNTTAKITSQHGLIYDKLINNAGIDQAGMYLHANQASLKKYKQLCKEIDCDYEEQDAYVYSLDNRDKIEKEVKALQKLNFKAGFIESLPLPFGVAGAIKFSNQAQFNPLKFISTIAKDLQIYENTFVKKVFDHKALTEHGTITAKKIIIATHFPFINKHGSYFLKMYQHRSYVIALENATNVNGMYVDEAEKGMSFRNYENLLLIGGGDHRTGEQGGCWKELRNFGKRYYPKATEKYHWATQDCMTLDSVPYIGNYSMNTPDLYVATGFNKWGMTSSMVAAMILSDMITKRKNDFAEVFSPSRSILKPQLAVNASKAIKNLLTLSPKRCPHLGCALKWNQVEHTWDCSCHGSRFEGSGKLINNPAMRDINIRKS
jgi:glycine/D-amino acid oxidase-like deaminating enzyme